MQGAYGDFQVSLYSATVEARTIGAKYHSPALDLPARNQDTNLFYGLSPIQLPVQRLGVRDLGQRARADRWIRRSTNTRAGRRVRTRRSARRSAGHGRSANQKSNFLMPNGVVRKVRRRALRTEHCPSPTSGADRVRSQRPSGAELS